MTYTFRKSSYSGETNDACIEVADNVPDAAVRVRDSKDTTRPALTIGRDTWHHFVTQL
ncbi:DUF397 domain-containing protein [Streptomyces daliensis]|uniref:DUF397 domain-containing protein n=1 Tax=Streptomyces daliensis TaxID=299421 RepID=A0A8T4IJI4_9ACTN|nr:DUF397 domain-containing protein [Streptomyces daliensis]